jgi:hypothetical protein
MIRQWVPFQEAGPFSPDDIAGLQGWYKADSLSLSNDDPVTSWNDSSGNGYTATTATGPTYKTNIQNSLPALLFDGTDDQLGSNLPADQKPFTLFAAVMSNNNSGDRTILGGNASGSRQYRSDATGERSQLLSSGVSLLGQSDLSATTTNTWVYVGATYSATGAFVFYRNGADFGGSGTNDVTFTAGRTTQIGASSNGERWKGYIGEILQYDSVLSTPDREAVEAYLADKWIPVPQQIAGLQGWWKADSLSLSDNDPVATWTDSSGNGNDATEATLKPTYKTAIQNGLPVVRFDDVDDSLTTTLVKSSGSLTIFAVYNRTAVDMSGGHRTIAGSNNWLMGPYVGKHELYAGGFASPAGPTVSAGVFVCQTVTLDSSTATNYVDGVSYGTRASPTYPGTIYFGYAGSFPESLGGDLCEVIVYDSVLSTTDRQAVEAYLADKWGL